MASTSRYLTFALVALALVACGDAPLASVGDRSSHWINEPQVTTTTRPVVNAPVVAGSRTLQWSNDGIETENLENPDNPAPLVAEIFTRREGDRFIQSSRFEIATIIPEIEFPALVPYGAEWVSSQLVIENTGRLSADPTVAFGIWSAEPYTRSRSVAQMAVLRVSHDPATASEIDDPDGQFSCARFGDVTTIECALLESEGRKIWKLTDPAGTTMVWFGGDYRYELFGRSFVPGEVLEQVAASSAPLVELSNTDSD